MPPCDAGDDQYAELSQAKSYHKWGGRESVIEWRGKYNSLVIISNAFVSPFFVFVPNVIRLGFEAKYGTLPVPLFWMNTVSVG